MPCARSSRLRILRRDRWAIICRLVVIDGRCFAVSSRSMGDVLPSRRDRSAMLWPSRRGERTARRRRRRRRTIRRGGGGAAVGRRRQVCNVVSVDYLTRPREIFRETHRVLRPGGRAIMSFSNRCFQTKAGTARENGRGAGNRRGGDGVREGGTAACEPRREKGERASAARPKEGGRDTASSPSRERSLAASRWEEGGGEHLAQLLRFVWTHTHTHARLPPDHDHRSRRRCALSRPPPP